MIPYFKKNMSKYVYKPEYCDDLIKYMAKGYSNLELAAKFKVSEKTFYEWRNTHEDFEEAYEIGDPQRFAFLMQKADEIFLEERNDKGYKHWVKKVSYMYKNYSPELDRFVSTGTTNNIQIGNLNMVEYQDKSESQLYEILQTKLAQIKPVEIKVIEHNDESDD